MITVLIVVVCVFAGSTVFGLLVGRLIAAGRGPRDPRDDERPQGGGLDAR